MGIIYSTNKKNNNTEEQEEIEIIPNHEQTLDVYIEKKNRGGKIAVVIRGFIGSSKELKKLCKMLQKNCGVGGSSKNKEIIIQGDIRDKVIGILNQKGYKTKRIGG